MRDKVGTSMDIINMHTRTRGDYHPTLLVSDKREAVLACLKHTGCPMNAIQVIDWVWTDRRLALRKEEVFHQFRTLLHEQIIEKCGKSFKLVGGR